MDSHRASFHDAFRGVNGAFDGAVAGIETLAAEGIAVQVIMSLVTDNAADIEGLIDTAGAARGAFGEDQSRQSRRKGRRPDGSGETVPVEELLALSGWVEKRSLGPVRH